MMRCVIQYYILCIHTISKYDLMMLYIRSPQDLMGEVIAGNVLEKAGHAYASNPPITKQEVAIKGHPNSLQKRLHIICIVYAYRVDGRGESLGLGHIHNMMHSVV